MANWTEVAVGPEAPLGEALAAIDRSGLQIALVTGTDGALLGILTDGDIRRTILAGRGLETPVADVMSLHPTVAGLATRREEMLATMRREGFHHLPLVDADGRVVGLVTLDEVIGPVDHPNWVVLMAGGLGTRLKPLTDGFPKPLLQVGGKPILETIVESFAEQGFARIFLSVNFEAGQIRNHFGTGDRWGVQIEYLHEDTPRGTAGALALLPERPVDPFIVMNGDILTRMNYDDLLRFHTGSCAAATMAVRQYEFQLPYGVVRLDGSRIQAIEEKPVHSTVVNAGIYTLSPDALDSLPDEIFFDMPTLFERLIEVGKTTVAYPVTGHWLDIGRLEEFERAQREWVEPNQ